MVDLIDLLEKSPEGNTRLDTQIARDLGVALIKGVAPQDTDDDLVG